MEIKWLEDFLAVARTGSFSQAARERNVTQPAFSRRVRSLEHWLGVALVDRSSFPVTLTRHGKEFLPHAQDIVSEALGIRQDFRLAARAERKQVRIVTLHTLAVHLVPDLVTGFLRGEPEASVDIIPNIQGIEGYFDALASGLAHIVVAYGQQRPPHGGSDLMSVTVARDHLIPVAAPDLHARHDGFRHFGTKLAPALLYTPFSFSHGLLQPVVAALGTSLRTRAVSTLGETLRALAVAGLGVAWLPRHAIGAELASGALVKLPGDDHTVPIEIVAWRRCDLEEPTASALFAQWNSADQSGPRSGHRPHHAQSA